MESADFTSVRPPGETADAGREAVGEAVRETGEDSGWVTTKVAAKALGVSRRPYGAGVRTAGRTPGDHGGKERKQEVLRFHRLSKRAARTAEARGERFAGVGE